MNKYSPLSRDHPFLIRHINSMHLHPAYYLTICQRLSSQMLFFPDFNIPSPSPPSLQKRPLHSSTPKDTPGKTPHSVYDAWLASRKIHDNGTYLGAGAQRQLTCANARLAFSPTVQKCVFDFVRPLGRFLRHFSDVARFSLETSGASIRGKQLS